MEKVHMTGSVIHMLPVIHALDEEEMKIRKAIDRVKPKCIAVGIPPEDVEFIGANTECENEDDDVDLSLQQEIYLAYLKNYGSVTLPPRDIQLAHSLAQQREIPFETIDMDDVTYADALTENVSMLALVRQSRRIKRIAKKGVYSKTAESFVIEWDNVVNGIASFKKVEQLREQHMAQALATLSRKYSNILAIVPLERYNGVLCLLERYKKEPVIPKT